MSRSSLPPMEDDFTRALLRSAEADEPPPAAYGKAASALGVGVALGVSASLPAPAGVAAAGGLGGAMRWSGSAVARLAAVGVSGALLVAGGALLQGRQRLSPASVGAGSALPAPAAPVARQAARAAVGSEASGDPASDAVPVDPALVMDLDLPDVAASSSTVNGSASARRVARTPAHALSAPSSSLAEQVQSLDRARVSLGSGDAGAALQEIAHYRKAWPKGVFLTEASVLEIEALAARGERARAANLASAFVAAHPDSPQAARLRRLIPTEKR